MPLADLPGVIKSRKVVDDVSDEDDDDVAAFLESGPSKKRALAAAHEQRSKKRADESAAQVDVAARHADADANAAAAGSSSGNAADSEPATLDDVGRELLAKRAQQARDLRAMLTLAATEEIDDDDDEVQELAAPICRRDDLWISVSYEPQQHGVIDLDDEQVLERQFVRVKRDTALHPQLMTMVQRKFGLDPRLVQMRTRNGRLLQREGTARQQRVDEEEAIFVWEEAPEVHEEATKTISVKLSEPGGRSSAVIQITCSAPLSQLVARYRAENPKVTAKARLRFDGDIINLKQSADDLDLEDDDMLEVVY